MGKDIGPLLHARLKVYGAGKNDYNPWKGRRI